MSLLLAWRRKQQGPVRSPGLKLPAWNQSPRRGLPPPADWLAFLVPQRDPRESVPPNRVFVRNKKPPDFTVSGLLAVIEAEKEEAPTGGSIGVPDYCKHLKIVEGEAFPYARDWQVSLYPDRCNGTTRGGLCP
jgi:hypothetical protein